MKQSQKDIQQILLSRQIMLITAEGYASAVSEAFSDNEESEKCISYPDASRAMCEQMISRMNEDNPVHMTTDYASEEIPEGSIAYYPVIGTITSDSYYFFSSKRFEKELLSAESNPGISAHFLHISSPGGEAFYLDRLSETMNSLSKPVVAYLEKVCASAAYLIACHADKVLAATGYDKIGSIGTVAQMWDDSGWLEKYGYKVHTYHASASDLKNKVTDDAIAGKGEEYILRFLNPLNDMFIREVRANRKMLSSAKEDNPVLRGELYLTSEAQSVGLIDGQATFVEAVSQTVTLAKEHSDIQRTKNKLLSII